MIDDNLIKSQDEIRDQADLDDVAMHMARICYTTVYRYYKVSWYDLSDADKRRWAGGMRRVMQYLVKLDT